MYDPRDNVFPRGGGIGQGLGMAIGAALAARPATVVLVGDGGLAVHFGELLTLAQERPWLVLLVFNDGGYGVLRNMQDGYGDRRSGVDLVTPDFARWRAPRRCPTGGSPPTSRTPVLDDGRRVGRTGARRGRPGCTRPDADPVHPAREDPRR